MRHLKHYFDEHPVIASIRNKKELKEAVKSDVIMIVIMGGSILSFPEMAELIQENDKLVFIHIDLVKGIARDSEAVKYLALNELCDGIISTKGELVQTAMREGLMGIQRLFLLDSDAVRTGKNMLRNNKPDALEVLPGVASPYLLERLKPENDTPIIAGGLIRTKQEIEGLKAKGVLAVSTGEQALWFK
ncbi:MAG: glycerol-3-phosphate responsive antiterminator [Bacillota bacterium]